MKASTTRRILMIDDDRKLATLVKDYLEPMGFQLDLRHDGATGLQQALEGKYDAIILDVMMPVMNGIEVLRELRKKSDVPVLMLTALGDESDRIVGLEIGADDYLPKTFSTRELLARLRAVTRRSQRITESVSTSTCECFDSRGDPCRCCVRAHCVGIFHIGFIAQIQRASEIARGFDRRSFG